MYANTDWEGLVLKVPDKDKSMEWVHLSVQTAPPLNILGTYLDNYSTKAEADEGHQKIVDKVK